MVDIDRLHNLFLNEDELVGRREGHTTLFVWQLIGLAELNCYSWNKIHQPVWIPFNKPICNVIEIFKMIGNICRENAIDFAKNSSYQFVIYNTLFEFYRIDKDSRYKDQFIPPYYSLNHLYWFSSKEDNDALYQERDYCEEGKLRYGTEAMISCFGV
jgi:hypothetical protein